MLSSPVLVLSILLLPASYTTWYPTDLDIYVPLHTFHYLTWLLNNHGYSSVSEGAVNHLTYSYSKIASIYTFSNGVCMMDVIISKTSAAFSPLFQFHSTALMNFVSHDQIFCVYPSLTLHHLSLINPGLLYANCFSDKHIDALQKYVLHGFKHVCCANVHDRGGYCRSKCHSITDTDCLWINTQSLPQACTLLGHIFLQYSIVNVNWLLGGRVCSSAGGFLWP
ncbi:hypothetical protein F5J12DRAFT_720340 [Pisolithus orientalis]|uniref:uncharacterized protein n=1 Tax=Pisolithus orientalis TaxID=936130 RepID=UPI002224E1A4|nr:uncharacterized protein F5J12DRAFT_720340 [Pisolithus orientalis]KAI6007535.1 hypothetical protein F5J12DRAFT_720340 [Pisolithus orientalis]